jgi:hypothetical protein
MRNRKVVKVVIARSTSYYGAWEVFLHWNTGHVEPVERSFFGPDCLKAYAEAEATKAGLACYEQATAVHMK